MTKLHYLGQHPSVAAVEEEYHRQRGSKDDYFAFGWTVIEYPDGAGVKHPQGCMVAWVPNSGPEIAEMGVWPVYIGAGNQPDLAGLTSWQWTNESREKPTLHPSILMEWQSKTGKKYQVAHGFVREGKWEGCLRTW